ncbi:uncharacterized protein LOC126595329 [Malus sylvestris]|uniref:uncharacterized protein LOC126595329 n=1 Tax=Malus sylvestris TaxID=3752 RepID=UPI0021ABFDA0|nr:uncharacterized protein LOC126595329 [Malus sylvestris]
MGTEHREGVGGWQKPGFGVLKLNCDVAWRRHTNEGEVRWVLRDFARIPKFAGREGRGWFGSAIMAEAEAVHQGLEAVVGSGMGSSFRLMVKSDSKGLIQMINKEVAIDVILEIYLQDIWRMASLFQSVRFCFTPHHCNRVAHFIAGYVVKHGGRFGWDELGPEFLFNILAKDAYVTIRI